MTNKAFEEWAKTQATPDQFVVGRMEAAWEASRAALLEATPDVAGLVAHLDSLVKHTKEVADSSQICDATAERYLINASYLQDTINALLSQAAQLQESKAECEGLRRDAERWRFLRDEEYDEHLLNYLVAPKIHRDSVDAAIDSARKEST